MRPHSEKEAEAEVEKTRDRLEGEIQAPEWRRRREVRAGLSIDFTTRTLKKQKGLPRNNLVPYIPIVFGLEFRFYWWVPDANGIVTVNALQNCEGVWFPTTSQKPSKIGKYLRFLILFVLVPGLGQDLKKNVETRWHGLCHLRQMEKGMALLCEPSYQGCFPPSRQDVAGSRLQLTFLDIVRYAHVPTRAYSHQAPVQPTRQSSCRPTKGS
jgi:hypothetical protein